MFSVNLDAKGRLAIPARFREGIKECCGCQMVITIGLNKQKSPERGCLWLYPLVEWEIVEDKINSKSSTQQIIMDLQRFFVGSATQCDMDAQGRLLLPEEMRRINGLEKQVKLVGEGNKFNIWNEEIWNELFGNWLERSSDNEDLEVVSDISF